MNEENTNIPQLDSPEDQMREELRPYLLDPREDYPDPYYMFEYNGVPFSTLGGIQAITGQKKNGKTFVLSMLMAAALLGNKDRPNDNLGELRVPQRTIDKLGHQPRVLYVDTEMEKLNSAKVLRRVHWLCGWDMKEPHSEFNVLWLREVDAKDDEPAYKKRYRLIKYAITVTNPDIVFIDGIRDIIGDFNDNTESSALIQSLMSLASKRGICIWNALHMNPRPGNDDESKMRGHLGTETGNKVSDTLASVKKKDMNGKVTFTVKQIDARGKDMEDWSFEVTDEAGNLGVPKIVSIPSKPIADVKSDDPELIRQWIEKGKETYEWPLSRKDIKKFIIGEIGGIKNEGRRCADLTTAINLGYLQETTIKSNGYPMLMPPEDLPF